MKRPPAGLVLFLVTIIWGSTFVVTRSVLDAAPPLLFLAVRFGIAVLVFLPIIAWRGLRRTPHLVRDGLVLGVLNASGLLFQVFGQLYTTPAKSAFLTSLSVPVAALCGFVLYRNIPTRLQRIAVVLATVGLALLTWPPPGAHFNTGDLLTVGCAVMYAIFIVESARRAPRHDAFTMAVAQVFLAAVLFIATALLAHEPQTFPHGGKVAWQMAYLSVVCVVVVMVAQTWAVQRLSATTAAVIYSAEPVVATAMAVALSGWSAAPGPRGTTGALLVLCAVYVAEGRDLRRLLTRSSAAATNSHEPELGVARQPTNEQPPEDFGTQ